MKANFILVVTVETYQGEKLVAEYTSGQCMKDFITHAITVNTNSHRNEALKDLCYQSTVVDVLGNKKQLAPSPTVSGSPLTETRWLPESSAAILKEKTGGGIMKRRCIFFVSLFTKRQAHFWWDSRCPKGMV